jgi:hypothetical protein
LTDEQKAPYEAKAAKDKKRYEEEKANYNVSILYLHAIAGTLHKILTRVP